MVMHMHEGEHDKAAGPDEQAAGADMFHGQDRWVITKVGLGDNDDIDFYCALADSAKREEVPVTRDRPVESGGIPVPRITLCPTPVPRGPDPWTVAEWSRTHPNWDGVSNEAGEPPCVRSLTASGQSWQMKAKHGVEQYIANKARAAVKAKLRHLTGAWVEPMLDFGRMSNWDVFYLVTEHMYMDHMAHISQLLIVMHTLSQSDVLAMPIFVSLFFFANLQFPKIRAGFWSSAIGWTVFEMILRYILLLDVDLFGWREACKIEYRDAPYTALSNCACIDDGNFQWYLVLLFISLLHSRESMRRQGQWRATSTYIMAFFGGVMLLSARLLQLEHLTWVITTVITTVLAHAVAYKLLLKPERIASLKTDEEESTETSEEEATQCTYCKDYCRKLSRDQMLESSHIQSRDALRHLNRFDSQPCLYRVEECPEPEGVALTRGKFCATCGSPTVHNVEQPSQDPASRDELSRWDNDTGRDSSGEMIIVNITFCPLSLECVYEMHECITHAFVWARVVGNQTVLVAVIEPTMDFFTAGSEMESSELQQRRMKRHLEEVTTSYETKHGELSSSLGVRSEKKKGWPLDLKVPTHVCIINAHIDFASVQSKFVRQSKGVAKKKSRIDLRATFAPTLERIFGDNRKTKDTKTNESSPRMQTDDSGQFSMEES